MTAPAPFDRWYPDAPVDGTYGYDRRALLDVVPADVPDGFAAFWRDEFDRARATPADPVLVPLGDDGAHEISRVEFTAADGLRLGGWVALPLGGAARAGVVHSHGYGGREFPDLARVPDDAAAIFPVARGLPALSSGRGAPSVNVEHVLHGIGSVRTYAVARSAVDLWHAGSALCEIVDAPDGALPLYVVGKSFGGGVGALAAPWDDRVVGTTLVVPSFGGHDLRLTMPCLGSGEAVRHHVARHPEARRTLRWSDASAAARYLRVPARVETVLWDTHVPPPGQFAIANAVPAHLLDLEIYPAGHAWYPGLSQDEAAAAAATRAHVRATAG
ncbi:acetylxylan esterase [Isoptericola aurantiacus]|uniref:acetylxylan esterase n=1 Tax=Isoptericola aurantiacus TaxID=3377839 RepID=UPI003839EA44